MYLPTFMSAPFFVILSQNLKGLKFNQLCCIFSQTKFTMEGVLWIPYGEILREQHIGRMHQADCLMSCVIRELYIKARPHRKRVRVAFASALTHSRCRHFIEFYQPNAMCRRDADALTRSVWPGLKIAVPIVRLPYPL